MSRSFSTLKIKECVSSDTLQLYGLYYIIRKAYKLIKIYLISNYFSVNVALSHAEWHYYACAMHFLTCEIRISMKTYHGMLQHVLPGIKA